LNDVISLLHLTIYYFWFDTVRLPWLQHHRQRINHPVGAPARQEMPCTIDHNHLLNFLPAHRFCWTILCGYRVHVLGEIGIVLRVNVILVAGHNADRMDPHERSVPDEVRIK